MAGFLGLRSTDDWVSNERPENWSQALARLYPNGETSLTGLITMARSEKTDDPKFHWWEKSLATQSVAVTGVYNDVGLSSAYTSGATAGKTLYFKMAEASVTQFCTNKVVLLRYSGDYLVDVRGIATDVHKNGASSYVAVYLLEADDNSASYDLSDCNVMLIIGSANAEGAAMPDAVSYDPTERWNYTQIFRTSLEITGTAQVTKLRRDPGAYAELKREAGELFQIEREKALLFGKRAATTGSNGKPLRTTMGLIDAITTYSSNTGDFRTNTTYAGKGWTDAGGGKVWLDNLLMALARYGARDKLVVIGDAALLGINQLAEQYGTINISPETTSFGLDIHNWITPFGTYKMLVHPLFSYETTNANSMLIFEPKRVKTRVLRPVRFKNDANKLQSVSEGIGLDSLKEEFICEIGFQYEHASTFGWYNGVGQNNTLTP